MNHLIKGIVAVLFLGVILFQNINCSFVNPGVNLQLNLLPYQKLSEYNLFTGDLSNLTPNEGVLPYDLNTPLFSDYAHKARFIWMPKGETAKYQEHEAFDFPVYTTLVKNFYYPSDFRKPEGERRIMETRLLINTDAGWKSFAYVWNDEQTDALYEIAGDRKDISWVHYDGSEKQLRYSVPNQNQCKGCHDLAGALMPIGPKARNLNKEYAYSEGSMNQLVKWQQVGYLEGLPDLAGVNRMPVFDDENSGSLNDRARAWLDVNCAHCHNPDGPANTSGLFLDYNEKDLTALGFCKSPVAAGRGSGGHLYDIMPGQPENSILTFRMKSNDPGIMMPELGRKMVHEEGVKLVEQWIASLEGECGQL